MLLKFQHECGTSQFKRVVSLKSTLIFMFYFIFLVFILEPVSCLADDEFDDPHHDRVITPRGLLGFTEVIFSRHVTM